MLLSRAEMTFDFGGAKFEAARDGEFLAWSFSQFLYGEVTGIQCGHWLYHAPDLDAAAFFAKQAGEELSHVRSFLRILELLGAPPQPPHRVVKFLSTGFMGGTFEEHVSLEMAQGEGLVLMVFYALIDTLDHPEIVRILEAACVQEERHVAFGEERTARAVAERPGLRRRLLGLNLVSLGGTARLARWMQKRMPAEHPVLRQLPAFLARANDASELRLRRMGLLDRPLAELGRARRAALMLEGLAARYAGALLPRRRRLLTDTYLADPVVRHPALAPPETRADS
jgi:hypothetical protein